LIETDVLIVGCGPAGLTAATALARQGSKVVAITKHRQLAPTPRAHVTNQRTFEILRDFDLETQAMELATSYTQMPNQIFLRSLASVEFGRIKGLSPDDPRNRNASPCTIADLPQNLLEPILFEAAIKNGANMRLSTELISFVQDEQGITAEVEDHVTGETMVVHARYLIGADGGRSRIAEKLGLPFEGSGKIGSSLNILFDCDLAPYVAHRPGLLYFIIRAPQDPGGAGLGILRCIKPWTRWLMIKGYEAGQETPHLSEADAATVIREYLGLPELELTVTGVDPWDLNSLSANVYQRGRVFCMGDAVHRHPPSNGLGSNTAIQDAFNLAWKIDLVLKGKAGRGLLESYSQERVPVGRQVVNRATKSMESYVPIINTILNSDVSQQDLDGITDFTANTQTGSKLRAELQATIHEKIYEFQARGLELNQLYRSSAIIDDGQKLPASPCDLELFYAHTTIPGARLPHAWVQRNGLDISTLDIVGKGRFTLLTGVGGEKWTAAAKTTAARLDIEISVIAIGPGLAINDLYFEWAQRREIAEDGCLLVRPDQHIAWRCQTADLHKGGERLWEALNCILDRDVSDKNFTLH